MHELSKHTGYSVWEQLSDVAPEFSMSLVMGAMVYALNALPASSFVKLVMQIIVGVFICVAIARGTHMESWNYVIELLKRKPVRE